ncbi:MAG: TonB-dependent receptor domain-containing protein [Campylobacter sp.]
MQKFGPGGHGQEWKIFNIDKTRRVGFEIGLKERIFDMLDFTQSYSFVDAKIKSGKNNGKEVPFVSKHKFVFGVTYEPVRDLAIFADLKYHSAQRDIKDEKNIKSRTITDVGANYKFANGLSLGAGVKNLFNKKYFDYVDVENDLYTPANERNFYARIKYEF